MRAPNSTYLLDNAGAEAPARLGALTEMFDESTKRHLRDRGVGPGWRCLEVGGGSGTIASWLADRTLPNGHVVVTDLDTRFLEPLARSNLEVRAHDIARDPLPDATFDLIHARLVLVHLPEWERVLRRLVAALAPGGWLVAEEFDSESVPPDPIVSPGETAFTTQGATARLMVDHGFDRRFGRLLFGRFRDAGLMDVGAEGRLTMVHRGSPGSSLVRANWEQLRGAMIDAGYVTSDEVDRDVARLDDPGFMMPSSVLWSAWGQRPR
jgi:SAM-dependent methyltransferase